MRNSSDKFKKGPEGPVGASVDFRLRFGHWAATSAQLGAAQKQTLKAQLQNLERENRVLEKRLEVRGKRKVDTQYIYSIIRFIQQIRCSIGTL